VAEIAQALGLAGFGALVRYAQRFTGKKEERPEWEWRVAALSVAIGSFVGLLTFWIIGKKFEADYVHFAVAIAGYGGPLTLDAFWDAFRNTINRTSPRDKDGDAKP
jgi:hypothetical protein